MTRWRWLRGKFILWTCRHRTLSAVLGFLLLSALMLVPVFLFQPGFFGWLVNHTRYAVEVALSVITIFCLAVLTVALFVIAIYNIFFREDHNGRD